MSNATAAKANTTKSTSSRRSKKSQEVTLKDTATVDRAATQQESNTNADKGAQVIAMPQINLKEAPKEEPVEISLPPLPGNRPIALSNLKVSEVTSLPGNRPIDTGNLQVVGTISALGERPIAASIIEVLDTISVSGDRPIASSSLKVSETAMIMGNRPIAINNIDGDEDLMGYLD